MSAPLSFAPPSQWWRAYHAANRRVHRRAVLYTADPSDRNAALLSQAARLMNGCAWMLPVTHRRRR